MLTTQKVQSVTELLQNFLERFAYVIAYHFSIHAHSVCLAFIQLPALNVAVQ